MAEGNEQLQQQRMGDCDRPVGAGDSRVQCLPERDTAVSTTVQQER